MSQVFVYGTLLVDEVLETLLKRIPDRRNAVLHGFKRHRIQQQVFPAMTPGNDADQVHGQVLSGLTVADMDILDDYEDDDYVRLTVHPELEDGTTTPAYTYVWQQSKASLLYGEWDLTEFREKHLQPYLQMSQAFAFEYAASYRGGAKVGGAGSRSS